VNKNDSDYMTPTKEMRLAFSNILSMRKKRWAVRNCQKMIDSTVVRFGAGRANPCCLVSDRYGVKRQ